MLSDAPVICIAAGKSQLPLIRRARELGFPVIGVDRDPQAPGMAWCDERLIHSTHDPEGVVAGLRNLLGERRPAALVARTTGRPLYTAAAVAAAFGLPGPTEEVIGIAVSKSRLREWGRTHGIPVPPGVGGLRAPPSLEPGFENRWVLRPDETVVGKKAIRVVAGRREMESAFPQVAAASANGLVDVASYVDGVDVTCLCRARNGSARVLAWWDELVGLDADGGIEGLGASLPSVVEGTSAEEAAAHLVDSLVRQLPGFAGLLLISLRIDFDGRPYLIELHADLGGDLLAEVLLPAGNPEFDFFILALSAALDESDPPERVRFSPKAMYHRRRDGNAIGHEQQPEHRLFREATVPENLAALEREANRGEPFLGVLPRHRRWLEQWTTIGTGRA